MKAEFDKEIDSLLRERARRGLAASVEAGARAGGASPSAHLDADEQSAYAENALPAVARAHYTAHLADCDDCRHGVTRLALAAGIPAQLEPRETATVQAVAPRVTWRERLGALLAPRAWRYAVPALALLLVSAVALIVLTQKRAQRDSAGETSIARRNTSNAQRPQAEQDATHHAPQNGDVASSATATNDNQSTTGAPDSKASPAREEIAANNPPVEAVQPSAGAGDVAPPPPAPSSVSATAERSVSVLPIPAATPAPEPLTVTSDQQATSRSSERVPESAKSERSTGGFVNRQYEDRRDQISGPRRNEQARNTRDAANDDSTSRADKKDGDSATMAAPASPAAARRTRQREADRSSEMNRPAEDSERSEGAGASAETRTVAGRKFRRQGGAWIDTAYNAGQSYTVVRRNSEQFRALVADEPELRRIAGALGGEVTVVWKGRAYRIR